MMWNDHRDGRCSMADACSNPPDAEVYFYPISYFILAHAPSLGPAYAPGTGLGPNNTVSLIA